MAYGRHQSFYIKINWINKGIKAVDDKFLMNKSSGYKDLGIGKNMFIALNYWLRALNIVDSEDKNLPLTSFGIYIKEYDLACNKPFTLNLLHYYLSLKEPLNKYEKSHSFYYLFNLYKNRSFTKEELAQSIVTWESSDLGKSTSLNSINKDIDCLIQTYTKSEKAHPEDLNISILSKLQLLKREKDYLSKLSIKQENLSLDVFYYMILRLCEENEVNYLEIDEIENSEMSPGMVFNMSRLDIIDALEGLIHNGYPITLSRTNNLDTVSINTNSTAEDFINKCFAEGCNNG